MFPGITTHPYFCSSPEMAALRYSVTDTAATSATVPPKTSGTHSYHRLNSVYNCFLLLSETIQWQNIITVKMFSNTATQNCVRDQYKWSLPQRILWQSKKISGCLWVAYAKNSKQLPRAISLPRQHILS